MRKAEPEAALQCLQHTPLIIRSPVSDLIDHLKEKLLRTESPVYKSADSAHSDFLPVNSRSCLKLPGTLCSRLFRAV